MTRRLIALGFIISILSACSVLPKPSPSTHYILPSSSLGSHASTTAQSPINRSLKVDTPDASQVIDSRLIAVMPGNNVISNYKGARWSDRAPVLIRTRLVEGFRTDGRLTIISNDTADVGADYELSGDLVSFQSEYVNGQPIVVIVYDAQLVQNSSQSIVASKRFVVRLPAARKEIPQVVTAFGQASDELTAHVVQWAVQTVSMPLALGNKAQSLAQ